MPTYGKKKIKDMVKSVLPSARRKSARDNRRLLHQQERAVLRAKLQQYMKDPESYEDDGSDNYNNDVEIQYMVSDRRAADKIRPLERWAVANTKHMKSLDEKKEYIRGLLPGGTIGEHALSHVEIALKYGRNDTQRKRPLPKQEDPVEVIASRLARILADGRHGEFNHYISKERVKHPYYTYYSWRARAGTASGLVTTGTRTKWRKLLGFHDTKDFAALYLKYTYESGVGDPWEAWRKAVRRYLEAGRY